MSRLVDFAVHPTEPLVAVLEWVTKSPHEVNRSESETETETPRSVTMSQSSSLGIVTFLRFDPPDPCALDGMRGLEADPYGLWRRHRPVMPVHVIQETRVTSEWCGEGHQTGHQVTMRADATGVALFTSHGDLEVMSWETGTFINQTTVEEKEDQAEGGVPAYPYLVERGGRGSWRRLLPPGSRVCTTKKRSPVWEISVAMDQEGMATTLALLIEADDHHSRSSLLPPPPLGMARPGPIPTPTPTQTQTPVPNQVLASNSIASTSANSTTTATAAAATKSSSTPTTLGVSPLPPTFSPPLPDSVPYPCPALLRLGVDRLYRGLAGLVAILDHVDHADERITTTTVTPTRTGSDPFLALPLWRPRVRLLALWGSVIAPFRPGAPHSVALDEGGNRLAVGFADGTVAVMRVRWRRPPPLRPREDPTTVGAARELHQVGVAVPAWVWYGVDEDIHAANHCHKEEEEEMEEMEEKQEKDHDGDDEEEEEFFWDQDMDDDDTDDDESVVGAIVDADVDDGHIPSSRSLHDTPSSTSSLSSFTSFWASAGVGVTKDRTSPWRLAQSSVRLTTWLRPDDLQESSDGVAPSGAATSLAWAPRNLEGLGVGYVGGAPRVWTEDGVCAGTLLGASAGAGGGESPEGRDSHPRPGFDPRNVMWSTLAGKVSSITTHEDAHLPLCWSREGSHLLFPVRAPTDAGSLDEVLLDVAVARGAGGLRYMGDVPPTVVGNADRNVDDNTESLPEVVALLVPHALVLVHHCHCGTCTDAAVDRDRPASTDANVDNDDANPNQAFATRSPRGSYSSHGEREKEEDEEAGGPVLANDQPRPIPTDPALGRACPSCRDRVAWVEEVPAPVDYLRVHWPLRHVAVSPYGEHIAVAGARGIIIYDRRTGTWRRADDAAREASFTATHLCWSGSHVVAVVTIRGDTSWGRMGPPPPTGGRCDPWPRDDRVTSSSSDTGTSPPSPHALLFVDGQLGPGGGWMAVARLIAGVGYRHRWNHHRHGDRVRGLTRVLGSSDRDMDQDTPGGHHGGVAVEETHEARRGPPGRGKLSGARDRGVAMVGVVPQVEGESPREW